MSDAKPINLAVLVSGSGTTLQNLIDLIARGELAATISTVIGSRDGLGAEARAMQAGVPYHVVRRGHFTTIEHFSDRVFSLGDAANADLVVCAGWLALLRVPERYTHRVINVHPSLLPSFGGKGMFGRHVQEAVLAHGCKVTGCTVHFVDDHYDSGPIIAQRTCAVRDDDTPETLAARVQAEERVALPEAIDAFHGRRLAVHGRRVVVRRADISS